MPKLPFNDRSPSWTPTRRMTLAAIGLVCLLAIAAVIAFTTGRSGPRDTASSSNSPTPQRSSSPPSAEPSADTGTVARPPRISDPLGFARAAAGMLWSYDTRNTDHDQQLAGMKAWMTSEDGYADWDSVAALMPDPTLWSRMADQGQHAGASIAEAHYPSAFKQALTDDPSKITQAYIYAVTVTGKQHIAWAKGGSGTEDRSITMAVQCRPSHDCSLVAIAPSVAP